MATKQQRLEQRIEELEQTLRSFGMTAAPPDAAERPEDRADYIAFGSPEHAAFLGLIEVGETDVDGRITHTSSNTGTTYCLEDEVTPFMTFPDPLQIARLVLRQKVSEFEAGPPTVPANAPPMWRPRELR